MNNLLSAGFVRLKKSKIYYSALGVILLYCVFVYVSQYLNMKKYDLTYSLEPLFFNFLPMIGIISAVYVSLFMGTEYSDGTIRNKLIIGNTRTSIYLSHLLVCITAETILILFGYMLGILLGIPLFGVFQMPASEVVKYCILGLLSGISYTAIFYTITMLNSSKANSAVICLLVAFAVLILGIYILDLLVQPEEVKQLAVKNGKEVLELAKNPSYLAGKKRDIYQFILDFLPSGQCFQMFEGEKVNIIRMYASSVLTTIGISCMGIYLFWKKDIK